ncbi:GNAT family N-acetyltransferase [Fulvivirga sp.]|jgi:ribosomal-protein-alanine N-acetyltransferase|uniref:GNAT family N-acetyltransferase n=1 Tax=Fulvivirga sp. TaxID=1931237 RepID=UPI0032EEE332
MIIRKYTSSDWNQVKTLFELNTPKYFAPEEIDDLNDYLETYADTYFVIEHNKQILGAGGYHIIGNKLGRLSWYFFNPESKGQGYGTKIVQHSIDEMVSKNDLESIEVWTSQYAEKFFRKFDLKTVKIENNFWAKGIHLYLMRRSL